MPYDLFISYSRRDNAQGRITQLVQRLSRDFQEFAGRPLNPFFDAQEIEGMQDWRHRILQGLKESRLLLACLSPAYLQSEYCEWDFVEYLKHELARAYLGEGVAPIYFVEVPGWGDQNFEETCAAWVADLRRRQHFDLRPWFHEGEAALRDVDVKGRLELLGKRLAGQIQRGEREEHRLGNLDRYNENFKGRVTEMRRLHELAGLGQLGVLTAVHGLGGIGKTALALQYAHAYGDTYSGGCWQIRCEGQTDLRAAFASLAGAWDLAFEFTDDEKKSPDLQFERVLRELKQRAEAAGKGRVLIILDNVDRVELLEPEQTSRLPRAKWLVLLATTRLGPEQLADLDPDSFLPVDEMPEEDALALMEAYQRHGRFASEAERQAAREIVRLVGRLPLAVEAAAVFLGQYREVNCAAFLARLQKDGLAGLESAAGQANRKIRHGEKRLSITLQPTLERLSEPERLALSYAALLPADQVALPWLRSLVAQQFPEIGQDAEPGWPDPWQNLLRHLLSLRLWQVTGVTDAEGQPLVVRMHRILQEVVNQRQTEEADRRSAALMAYAESRAGYLWDGWVPWQNRWEIEPLRVCAWQWLERELTEAAVIANQLSSPLQDLGNLAEARRLLQRAIEIDEKAYAANHPNLATSYSNLAVVEQALGNQAEARRLLQRAIKIDEKAYAADHPTLAIRYSNLARGEKNLGNLAEAESMSSQAVKILLFHMTVGQPHPHEQAAIAIYCDILKAMGQGRDQILARLNELGSEFGVHFGDEQDDQG